MADYPVRDGAGSIIVAGYQVDQSFLEPNSVSGDYPTKDGLGAAIIPNRGILPKSRPVRTDTSGRSVVASYPTKDGLGNNIITYGTGGPERASGFVPGDWTPVGLTVPASGILAPDGVSSTHKLTEDASLGVHLLVRSYAAVLGDPFTQTTFLKSAGRNLVQMQLDDGTNSFVFAELDLATGASAILQGAGVVSAQDYGDGWWRWSLTGTPPGTTARTVLYVKDGAGPPTYQGDGASGVLIFRSSAGN